MIRQRTRRSTTCWFLAVIFLSLVAPSAVADDGVEVLIDDGFEDAGAPMSGWSEVVGCPVLEGLHPIAESQSLRLGFNAGDCRGEEADVICKNLAPEPNLYALFWADLADLELPEGGSFKIVTLLQLQNSDLQALSVRLGQDSGGPWVVLEAAEDAGNVVVSARHGLGGILEEGTLLRLAAYWNQGDEKVKADGSVRLSIAGTSSSLSIDLEGLRNETLTPDLVRLGIAELHPPSADPGSVLVDDFVLWANP